MVANYAPSTLSPRIEPWNGVSPSTPLNLKSAQITFDNTWSPYIQGTMVCHRQSAADALATDPRNGLMAKLTLQQQLSGSALQSLALNLFLRSRSTDFVAGETTLTLAGAESILQDFLLTNQIPTSTQAVTQTDVQWINQVLNAPRFANTNAAILAMSTIDGSAAQNVTVPANTAPPTGQSQWDYILSMEEPLDLWVRADETGALIRSAKLYSADTSTHYLADTDRIVNVVDTVARDDPNWGNFVLITYSPPGGSTVFDFSTNTVNTFGKHAQYMRPVRSTFSGAANKLVARSVNRGRSLVITAIADLAARPNMTYQATFQGYTWTGLVRAVTFRWPEGLMDLTLDITNN